MLRVGPRQLRRQRRGRTASKHRPATRVVAGSCDPGPRNRVAGMSHAASDESDDADRSISVEDHLARIMGGTRQLSAEMVDIDQALGRVVAEAVTSVVDVPPFDNSAMDGYAMRRADVLGASGSTPVVLPVTAELPAGSGDVAPLAPGTAARIMTGAPIPAGADIVIPQEQTDCGTHQVAISTIPARATHIRRAGEDVRTGQRVLTAGSVVTGRHIAAAASISRRELSVRRRPTVVVVSIGDELVEPGRALGAGQIPDSNSHLLAAAVRDAAAIPIRIGPLRDNEQAVRDTLAQYSAQADAFILSGGVSVGAFDVVRTALTPLGVWFGSVRMQPGAPQGYGSWTSGAPIFALPGNPVSAFVSFEVFVRPALLRMQGFGSIHRPLTSAVTSTGWRSGLGRRQYVPVAVESRQAAASDPDAVTTRGAQTPIAGAHTAAIPGTHPVVTPVLRRHSGGRITGGSGSHLVARLAGANGLAVIGEATAEVIEGDQVSVVLLTS